MGNLREIADKLRSAGPRAWVIAIACWALILACEGQSHAQGWQTARKPQGVYAKVDLHDAINEYFNNNPSKGSTPAPCPPPAEDETELRNYLKSIYRRVLMNNAVAGIAAGAHWCLIQGVDSDGADWNWLDDVFAEAAAVNKNVQLLITPGNDSPSWLFSPTSCDPVIAAAKQNSAYQDCGWVTFSILPEALQTPDNWTLPLPWSSNYNHWWKNFLQELHERYGHYPQFASIAVAGPVSLSTELILPTSANGSQFQANPTLRVDTGWKYLIDTSFPPVNPKDVSTAKYYGIWDQAFIDAWRQTILTYENIFSGVTLTLAPDDGKNMPEIGHLPPGDPTDLVGTNCTLDAADYSISCAAKATVMSAFIEVGGPNEKATVIGGFTASSKTATGDIGLPGVKLLTTMTMPPQSPPFLGGADFDHEVSGSVDLRKEEGCVRVGTKCILYKNNAEQAAYNVLGNFFYGTIAAGHYGGQPFAPPYASPLHFLNMEYKDILYAKTHPCMQQLIAQASVDLLATAGKSPLGPLELDSCDGLIVQ
jgi:hypothetical protein